MLIISSRSVRGLIPSLHTITRNGQKKCLPEHDALGGRGR